MREKREREERRAYQQEEAREQQRANKAKDRCECNAMMQMIMIRIIEGQRASKRKQDDHDENIKNNCDGLTLFSFVFNI